MKGKTMKIRKYFTKKAKDRLISLFLSAVMIFSSLPIVAFTAMAAGSASDSRSVDLNTMDEWKNYIGKDYLSTKYAGGIFTDKSVFKDASAFQNTGITFTDNKDKTNFLVALSAIASNMDITGQSSVPTDTMLVLDVSGSMNYQHNDLAETLVDAANEAMAALLDANENNRVGVVLYSDSALELLPLDHYTTAANDEYLTYSVSGWSEVVGIDRDTRTSRNTAPTQRSKYVSGGTYIQSGLDYAADEFSSQANNTTVTVGNTTVKRKPVMVLLTDGAPTYGTTAFSSPGSYNFGNGEDTTAALNFVTQLTAAYAKETVSTIYGSEVLFYTLGLGVDDEDVLDPSKSSTAVNDLWENYDAAPVNNTITVQSGRNEREVTKISTALKQDYVDQYFEVQNNGGNTLASGLVDAFKKIVGAIQLESNYFPTLVQLNSDLEGYITFRDKIGHHMNVTDVKGLLLHNTLFSGAEMAKQFRDTGTLGTPEDPTELGVKFLQSVQERLGIADAGTAATLVALANEHKQLYWESDSVFSNYIGWYANANYEYLGFWHEGHTSVPADIAAEAKYIIRSYGYLGETDEAHGVEKSDMMFTTVRVSHDIATGDELVTFAVPASLIPVVTYHVTTDANGDLTDLTVDGAEHPIRLVYEVALADGIDPITVSEIAADAKTANGDYVFYTNSWENIIAYDEDNTYAFFTPSPENDRYYYTEPTAVYTDTNGTVYDDPNVPPKDTGLTYYRRWTVYEKDLLGLHKKYAYEPISDKSIVFAAWHSEEGHWHITADHPHTFTEDYKVEKGDKTATGTLEYSTVAFADVTNPNLYVTGYTMGNNGRLTVTPATGISVSKTVQTPAAGAASSFEFTVRNMNSSESKTYDAVLKKADGSREDRTVEFVGGTATIYLNAGETLYIVGMTAGESYEVSETETADYAVVSDRVQTVNVENGKINAASFVNTARGKGDLTITKEVLHNLQDSSFANESYIMTVTLTGLGTANKNFAAEHSGNPNLASIDTDANGRFVVNLKNGERFELFGLPEGTVAEVVETNPGAGYSISYLDNGVAGDGIVTVPADGIAAVRVENSYAPAKVFPVNISVGGTKTFTGRPNDEWLSTDSFTFQLQKYVFVETAGEWRWEYMAEDVATATKKSFDFNGAFANEEYTKPGVYYYRVVEIIPDTRIPGVTYDRTVHSFGVHVDDLNIDGALEITDVVESRDTVDIQQNGNNWTVTANFTNTYSNTGSATVSIDITKSVLNPSGSPLASKEGFKFGLFDKNDALVWESNETTERGFTRLVMNFTAIGDYEYTLKELGTAPAYWSYDTKEIPVIVRVTDDTHGGYNAVIFQGTAADQTPLNTTSSMDASFENKYDPLEAEVKLTHITKVLEGRDLRADEFTFGVFRPGETSPIVDNNADATGAVDMPIFYLDTVGTHYFEVRERTGDGNGITADKTVYRIAVHVVDNGGTLSASYEVLNQAHNAIVFKNVYTATPVDITIATEKELQDKALVNDEFHFILTPSDANGNKIPGSTSYRTENQANGDVIFPVITLDKADTYYFVIEEEKGAIGGIVYDEKKILVTVKVNDNGVGALYHDPISYAVIGDANAEAVFVNKYVPAETKVNLAGQKTLEGRNLKEGEFAFYLYKADSNWQAKNFLEMPANKADGSFAFAPLTFTAEDFKAATSYYYVVHEAHGGETIDGVTYDGEKYRIRIDLYDDQMGYLHHTVHVFDSENVPVSGIIFENEYKILGTANAVISGEKELVGKPLKDGEFTFELYEADANYTAGAKLQSVKNVGKDFRFTLEYQPEDAGKIFYYVVKEEGAGETIGGVTFDNAGFTVKVEVVDNGDGTLGTVTDINANEIKFTNRFAADLQLDFNVNKTVKNLGSEKLGPEGFEFILTNTENSAAVTAKTNADGKAVFPLGYTEADLGKTYTYTLKEKNTGVANVSYSSAEYAITVTLSLDGENRLVAKITQDGKDVTKVVAAFENVYDYTPVPAPTEPAPKPPVTEAPEATTPSIPQTGDASAPVLWIALFILSGLGLIVQTVKRRKA